MSEECPICYGKKTFTSGGGEQRPCHLCHGEGSLPTHRALVWAMQHPGSALFMRFVRRGMIRVPHGRV